MTGSAFLVLATIALASYRVQRFITADSLTDPLRAWLWNRAFTEGGYDAQADRMTIVKRSRAWWYPYELLRCSWCSGVWTSAAGFALWTWAPWSWLWHPAVMIAAVSGIQGFIGSRKDA